MTAAGITVEELLDRFPFDEQKRGQWELYKLPRKLEAIDDAELRRLVAQAWLASSGGKAWARSLSYADHPYEADE